MEAFYELSFERTVLSSILNEIAPEKVEEMMSLLSPDIFYLPSHQDIFIAMDTLYRARKPIDEEFIKRELQAAYRFDENVLLEVLTANPAMNIAAYSIELRELSNKRKLIALTSKIKQMTIEEFASVDDVRAMIDLELVGMEDSVGITMPITMKQAIIDYDNMVEPPKIRLGVPKVDTNALKGGIEPVQLVHIGGPKNIGKTTLMKQILYNTSAGFDSLFFSLEMPAWKMAKQTKRMTGPADLSRYRIIDTQMMRSRDVMDIARMIRMMWRKYGIRFVLIDSKMKLTHKTFKGNSDSDRKGDIDAVLNAVVQETGIVLMMITQLSKQDIENGTMSNYGSGLSDYEADMQIILTPSKDFPGAVDFKVTKERQEVSHDPVPLWLNKKELKFDDVQIVEEIVYDDYPGSDEKHDKYEMAII